MAFYWRLCQLKIREGVCEVDLSPSSLSSSPSRSLHSSLRPPVLGLHHPTPVARLFLLRRLIRASASAGFTELERAPVHGSSAIADP